jgi:hypothetical protein
MQVKKDLGPAVDTMIGASAELVKVSQERKASFEEAAADLNIIWQQLTTFAEMQKVSAGQERQEANSISISATALGILISIFAGIGRPRHAPVLEGQPTHSRAVRFRQLQHAPLRRVRLLAHPGLPVGSGHSAGGLTTRVGARLSGLAIL